MIPLLLIATIEVQLPPCRPDWLDADDLIRLLAAETSTRTFDQLALAIPDCERAPEQMQLTITSSIGSATRELSFADVPKNARLRALAVSVGELEIAPPPPPPPVPIAIETKAPDPAPIPLTTSIVVEAGSRFHAGTQAFRARAGLTRSFWSRDPIALIAGLDLAFAGGARSFPQGNVRLLLVTAGTGVELSYRMNKRIAFGLGPRLELGWASISGAAAASNVIDHSADAFVASGALAASFRWSFADGIGLSVGLEGGLMMRGLEGTIDGERTGWRGPFGGLTAGLWFDL